MKTKTRRKKMMVQRLKRDDIPEAGKIRFEATKTYGCWCLEEAEKWIRRKLRSFPIAQIFVSRTDDQITGYVIWEERDGFHQEAVFEILEANMHPDHQNKGMEAKLIRESEAMVVKYLEKKGRSLRLTMVAVDTADKAAIRLYEEALGAENAAVLEEVFPYHDGDIALLIARKKKQLGLR